MDVVEKANELFGKDWNYFEEIDPFNPFNKVRGVISRRSNEFYGALIISHINNVEIKPQLIMGTPKMHYPFTTRTDGTRNYTFPSAKTIEIWIKKDGSNILAYRYLYKDMWYYTYKTRLRPFLGSSRFGDFYGMWCEVGRPHTHEIRRVIDKYDCNLSFELWGARNPHLIAYKNSLDIALLFGVTNVGRILSPMDLETPLPTTESWGQINKDYVRNYERIQKELQNSLRKEEEYYSGEEGTVWYLKTYDGKCTQLKCLDGRTRVLTQDGWKLLSNLVTKQMNISIASIENNEIVYVPITNWYRSKLNNRSMIRICLEHKRVVSNGKVGINITDDHLVKTVNGWAKAGELHSGDIILSGELSLNDKQMEFICGTMLGDAHIAKPYRFRVAHVNHNYSLRKCNALSNLWASSRLVKMTNYGHLNDQTCVEIPSSIWVRQQRERWYPKGVKIVPRDIVLNDLTLAIWYMDDGNLITRKTGTCGVIIATCGFSESDIRFLKKKLKAIRISTTVTLQNNLYLGLQSTKLFMQRVGRFIPPEMRYKATNDCPSFDADSWNLGLPQLGQDKIMVLPSSKPACEKSVYCLDTPTHNFITQGGVVHNCKPETIEAIHFSAGVKGINKNVILSTVWNALENVDVLTVDFVKQLLLEEFKPALVEAAHYQIEKCIVFVTDELEFRQKVLTSYRQLGMNINLQKGEVMRALSNKFEKNKMSKVYSTIVAYG